MKKVNVNFIKRFSLHLIGVDAFFSRIIHHRYVTGYMSGR